MTLGASRRLVVGGDASGERSQREWVAIDADGTLADVFPLVIKSINNQRGRNYSYEDYKIWGHGGLGISGDEFHARYLDAWNQHSTEIMPLTDEKRLAALLERYNVYIITSMSSEALWSFEKWLKRNFPGVADRLTVVKVHGQKYKLDNGFNFLIDDDGTLAPLDFGHRTCLLVNRPYNVEAKLGARTVRMASTNEAIDALLRR